MFSISKQSSHLPYEKMQSMRPSIWSVLHTLDVNYSKPKVLGSFPNCWGVDLLHHHNKYGKKKHRNKNIDLPATFVSKMICDDDRVVTSRVPILVSVVGLPFRNSISIRMYYVCFIVFWWMSLNFYWRPNYAR